MAIHNLSPRRNMRQSSRLAPAIFVALLIALLLVGVALMAADLSDSTRRAIQGSESGSADGRDPCADFRTARDHYEAGSNPENVALTFKAYSDANSIPYNANNIAKFLAQMERICP